MTDQRKSQWYVLTSKPREEQRAYDNLQNQGYEVFLPKVSKIKKRNGAKTVALEPLFPNYLFIRLDNQIDNFNAIRSTRGVGNFVRFGVSPAVIDPRLIDQIRLDTDSATQPKSLEELHAFKKGEKVEITDGPFKGLDAIYQTKDGLERSILLINLLGQPNEVAIDNQIVEKKL
ncbi:transcription/translation regulatory transformer protein RfaH [Thalassotalea aquiviva]|uniref:transcription/translation regulatory transformer protein RfaH n=1 Tax=Thalassotalea aquiviva TaxID=3242415 RepID=UPI00352B7AEE